MKRREKNKLLLFLSVPVHPLNLFVTNEHRTIDDDVRSWLVKAFCWSFSFWVFFFSFLFLFFVYVSSQIIWVSAITLDDTRPKAKKQAKLKNVDYFLGRKSKSFFYKKKKKKNDTLSIGTYVVVNLWWFSLFFCSSLVSFVSSPNLLICSLVVSVCWFCPSLFRSHFFFVSSFFFFYFTTMFLFRLLWCRFDRW